MYLNAENLTLDSDEGQFCLYVDSTEEDRITVNIHGIDLDAFYEQVRGRLLPYLLEAEDARRSRPVAFACDPDESGGYDTSDPKHPDWHSIHADIWDMRDKTEPRRGVFDMRRDLGRAPTAQEWQDERR